MVQSDAPAGRLVPKRRRFGCLGCIGQSALALLFGLLVVEVLTALLFPWAFFMGGKFHLMPYWQGVGKMRGPGGDYAIFLRMEPTPRGSRMYAHSNVRGTGYLCTPRGEMFPMKFGGEMRPYLRLSTEGEAIHIYGDYWPLWTGGFITDRRPSVDFRGHWQNPNLILDDHGSLTNAFQADGTIYKGHDRNRPYATKGAEFTVVEGSYSDFKSACAASH